MAIAGSLVVTVTARTQDFEQGMRKTTATLKLTEQQAASVAHAFSTLATSFSTAGSKSQSLNRNLQATSGVMGELKQQLTGLVAGFVAFSALKAGVLGVVNAALKQERLVSILTAVTGSQEKAAQAMAFARAEAERFGVAMNAATEGYARLLGATKSTVLEGQRTKEMYSNILAVMSTFKVSSQDQNDILRATTQILQQQAIQGDELKNEIGSRIPIMQKLVEASNGAFKTQLEFNKAMEEGKLKGEAASAIMYNLFQIMAREATKAGAAGQGAAAEFARFTNTIDEIKEAIGIGLLPALGEAARALTAFLDGAKEGAGVLGGALIEPIRQATSALIGLAGAFVVTGKAMAAFSVGLIGDTEAARIGWEDVGKTITDIVALQTKLISGGFAAKPGAGAGAVGGGPLLPVVPGGAKEDKAPTKTAAAKESERIAERQKDLVNEIANAYDAANAAVESGIELERTRMEQRLKEAQFSQADLDTLMSTYDATQRLLELRKTDEKLQQDRVQLSTQLQESLDKQLYTERELLSRKLTALGFTKEEAALKLKMYDTEVRLREEAEKRKQAEEDAVQATKDHLEALKRLQDQLQPRLRQTRNQELQGVISEMAGETSDQFTLAQADIQRQETLRAEWIDGIMQDLERMGEAAANVFTEIAVTGEINFKKIGATFSQMVLEMLADAIGLKEMLSKVLKDLVGQPAAGGQAGSGAMGMLGSLFGGGAGAGNAALQADISTSMAANPELFAFGGGMASGGPVMPGKFYTVGERGPETLVAGGAGHVIPNGGGQTFNMTVVTNDANSFRMNERQIAAQSARMLAHARRNL